MYLPWQTSDLHPHALSLTEDALTGADFADSLAADLAAFDPPETIHRYRIIAPAGGYEKTLCDNGFSATRFTTLTNLPLDLLSHPALDVPLPKSLSAHWFTTKERAPWGEWVGQHWRHYQATHRSNPPREPIKGVRRIFVGNDFVEGLALRSGPQGRVRAFASVGLAVGPLCYPMFWGLAFGGPRRWVGQLQQLKSMMTTVLYGLWFQRLVCNQNKRL